MTNIENYTKALDDVAKAEFERVWNMRDSIASVNEATLPILVQYCTTYSQIQRMTACMNSVETDEKEWDKSLARLDKLNKMLLSFVKVLKLCDGGSNNDSKNKFAKLLLNK